MGQVSKWFIWVIICKASTLFVDGLEPSFPCGHCSSWDLCFITLRRHSGTREQVLINETLNENRFYTDSGAAHRTMLLAMKEGKILLRNHLVLHQSLLLSAELSAAFLSVCLASHQRSSRLLFFILLPALAAEQHSPISWADAELLWEHNLGTTSLNSVFASEHGSHHSILRLFLSIIEERWRLHRAVTVWPPSPAWRREQLPVSACDAVRKAELVFCCQCSANSLWVTFPSWLFLVRTVSRR